VVASESPGQRPPIAIQDQEKRRIVEHPRRAIGQVLRRANVENFVIKHSNDLARRPLNRKNAVAVTQVLPSRQNCRPVQSVLFGVPWPVHRAVQFERLLCDDLHDVDFATARPADFAYCFAEHPERRPDVMALGQLHARFDPTVGGRELALGLEPGRGWAGLSPPERP
jgi:hypothetical protein